jgi:hypothetical protein
MENIYQNFPVKQIEIKNDQGESYIINNKRNYSIKLVCGNKNIPAKTNL